MDVTTLLYAVSELAALLLAVCVFLLIYLRRQKRVMGALEDKVVNLRDTVKVTKQNALALVQKVRDESQSYTDYLADQVRRTKTYHRNLSPDRDISLDLDPDVPSDRQAAALRHAFLIAEQECMYAGDGVDPVWSVLQAKFDQIIGYYRHAFSAPATGGGVGEDHSEEVRQLQEELAALKKRIQNLEKFKRLFFEMESKWEAARAEADDYAKQIRALMAGTEQEKDVSTLLDRYLDTYGQFERNFEEFRSISSGESKEVHVHQTVYQPASMGSSSVIISNQEEVERLRKLMRDQHSVISELQRKLADADTVEAKAQMVEELTSQLERQQRFLSESETCIQLLEEELGTAHQQIANLEKQLVGIDDKVKTPDQAEVEDLLNGYVEESREMLKTISALEQENESLKSQLDMGLGSLSAFGVGDAAADEALKEKIAELEQQYVELQNQHADLEERYLDLKASTL